MDSGTSASRDLHGAAFGSVGSVGIWLCGGLRIEVDGERVEGRLTRRKSRELLGLLVDRGTAVAREELVETLWPESALGSRAGQFRVLLTEIRQCLGAQALEGRDRLRVVLPGTARVDVRTAAHEIECCRTAIEERRWGDARGHAGTTLELLSGAFLAGQEGDWIDQRRRELEQLELEAIEASAAASLSEPGHAAGAVDAARRLVSRAPFRESGYSLLMRALVAEGNPAEALVAYERLRLLLREELGTIPSVALSALHVWVLEQAGEERGSDGAGHDAAADDEDRREPAIQYARRRDGVSIAHQVLGDGPVDLVVVPGFMSHLDLQWTDPAYRRWLRRLSSSLRVATLDKAGTGASDAVPRAQTIEEWADDVLAVLDAVGSSRAVLMGLSEGAPVAAFFAEAHPDRVRGLVFYGALARVLPNERYLWEHREEILASLQRFAEVELSWGCGGSVDIWAPTAASSDAQRHAWAIFERASGSPASIALRSEAVLALDACELLPSIRVPTLVLHRAGDGAVPVHHGRYLAAAIPGARYIELEGADHIPYLGNSEAVISAIHEFVAGLPAEESDRKLVRQP
jgi:pimeloyl-ACP methyl ester carboxylesterase/DNA-binding SARP family transcriptional activator